jgi:hypothetical protein
MASRTIIDASAGGSIVKLSLYSRRSQTMIHGRHQDTYFRFNPQGTSKDSCKWRTKIYSKARLIRLCGGWRRWR